MTRPVVILTDDLMLEHDPGPGHPERPDRLRVLHTWLDDQDDEQLERRAPTPADRALVERVHDPAYIERLESVRGQRTRFDHDTATSPRTIEAAYLAAGAAVDAVQVVFDEGHPAFAWGRPPGHHAERDRPMGFCFINSVAVAAQAALDRHGVERVLIVDWDVHHGNGTQHILEERGDVMYASIHRGGYFYPGTGAADERGRGPGLGTTVNCPLDVGDGDEAFLHAMREHIVPAARLFAPQLVLVSAGYDAHRRDPLGGLAVTTGAFAAITRDARALADECADGRIAFVLEGGYDLVALVEGVEATINAL